MSTATYSVQYRISEGVLARMVGDALVLFHPETERLLTVNGTGARIWQCLVEGEDAARITARMIEEYEGSEPVIRQQVLEFLSHLERECVICRRPVPA